MNIDDLLCVIQTMHGNSKAFRFAMGELRRLNDAAAEPIFEGLFDQHVSMLRHKRTGAKCREGCLRELQAIAIPDSIGSPVR